MSTTKTKREAIKQEEQNSTEKKSKRDGKKNCALAQEEAEKAVQEAEAKMAAEKASGNLDQTLKALDEIHAILSPVEAPETTPIKETPAPEASEVVTPTPPALTAPTSIKENVPAEEESTRIPFVPLANMLNDYAQAVFNQFQDVLSREAKKQFFTTIESFPRNGRTRLQNGSMVDGVLYKDMINILARVLEDMGGWNDVLPKYEKFFCLESTPGKCSCGKVIQPIWITGTAPSGKPYDRGNFYELSNGEWRIKCRDCQIYLDKKSKTEHEDKEKERAAKKTGITFVPQKYQHLRFLPLTIILEKKEKETARKQNAEQQAEAKREKRREERNSADMEIISDHKKQQEEENGRRKWKKIEEREREVNKRLTKERGH